MRISRTMLRRQYPSEPTCGMCINRPSAVPPPPSAAVPPAAHTPCTQRKTPPPAPARSSRAVCWPVWWSSFSGHPDGSPFGTTRCGCNWRCGRRVRPPLTASPTSSAGCGTSRRVPPPRPVPCRCGSGAGSRGRGRAAACAARRRGSGSAPRTRRRCAHRV